MSLLLESKALLGQTQLLMDLNLVDGGQFGQRYILSERRQLGQCREVAIQRGSTRKMDTVQVASPTVLLLSSP